MIYAQPAFESDAKSYFEEWQTQQFLEMTDEDYHGHTVALSAGGLKEIIKSPAHFVSSKTVIQKETPALRFGSIAHMAVLEGPKFLSRYKVMPEFVGLTKDGRPSTQSAAAKEKKAAWVLDQPKDTVILDGPEELDQITGMLTSIMNHKTAAYLIRQGRPEIAGLFNHKGIRSKLKADILIEEQCIIADLKTCIDASEDPFMKAAWKNKYLIQAAWYLLGASLITGKKWDNFTYIAVEKTPPYAVAVHTADTAYLEGGLRMVEVAVGRFLRCAEKGIWPAYGDSAGSLSLPQYAMYEIEALERKFQMEDV
jgi:hypothetical protein